MVLLSHNIKKTAKKAKAVTNCRKIAKGKKRTIRNNINMTIANQTISLKIRTKQDNHLKKMRLLISFPMLL